MDSVLVCLRIGLKIALQELKKWLCKNNIQAEVIFKETSVDYLLTDSIKPGVQGYIFWQRIRNFARTPIFD